MNNNYRPCEVKGKQAMFHQWVQTSTPIRENCWGDGAPAGQWTRIFGIIEYEDGSVSLEYPNNIVFTDLLAMKINTRERKIDKWKSLS